jgi:hypothetical protein
MSVIAEPDSMNEPRGRLEHPDDLVVGLRLHDVTERDVVEEERNATDLGGPLKCPAEAVRPAARRPRMIDAR